MSLTSVYTIQQPLRVELAHCLRWIRSISFVRNKLSQSVRESRNGSNRRSTKRVDRSPSTSRWDERFQTFLEPKFRSFSWTIRVCSAPTSVEPEMRSAFLTLNLRWKVNSSSKVQQNRSFIVLKNCSHRQNLWQRWWWRHHQWLLPLPLPFDRLSKMNQVNDLENPRTFVVQWRRFCSRKTPDRI